MAGTVIITGANGSLAIHAVEHLLSKTPDTTLILTVRNALDSDPNTKALRETIKRYEGAKTSIRALDLAILKDVHDFADTVATEVTEGKLPPLRGLVANAYYWNMITDPQLTVDGLETTIQVNHVSHAALALRLLNSFGSDGGRLVFFTSDAHYPKRNGLEKYPVAIPSDLDELVKAKPETDKQGHGFLRYANSKLAILMWTYALNRYLQKDEALSKISALATDPGNLVDSRALRTNTPAMLSYMQRFVLQPLRPILQFILPDIRRAVDAGRDVADLVLSEKYPEKRGYIRLAIPDEASSEDSQDEAVQEKLWTKTAEWAKIISDNTALKGM
ncbi:NAD(P)-binding protein [Xylariaceae sp. FL1019]|nr:NAD(P)-binding protein [Xylariaceae sp. FL1019]